MPDPTATYQVKNENGNILREIPLVLAEVRQSGCATATSNLLTVTDSTVLYVGMGVCCLDVTEGTYIVAIKDATTVVLSAVATGTTTGLVACFKGFNFVTISKTADRGWWRNTVSGTTAWQFLNTAASLVTPEAITGAFNIVPATFGTLGGPVTYTIHKSDELADTPTLRVKNESWSFWTLVSTGGFISVVPFDPEHSLHLKELSA